MSRRKRVSGEGLDLKRDSFVLITIMAYVFSLIYRIVLIYIIGEDGVAYFSIANETYIILSFVLSYAFSESVSALIRYRMKRGQYRSAERVLHVSQIIAIITGLVCTLLLLLLNRFFVEKIVNLPMSSLPVKMMAPAFVFVMLNGVYKGYFQGNGSKVPSIYSKVIETAVIFAGGCIGAYFSFRYGQKVSALLQNPQYAPAYGAMGASIGFTVAGLLSLLYMMFLHLMYKRKYYRQLLQDNPKNLDSKSHIVRLLIRVGLPFAVYGVAFHCIPFLDACLFFKLSPDYVQKITDWGNYYGKQITVCGILGGLVLVLCISPVKRIVQMAEHEEYRAVRDKIGLLIHQTAIFIVPTAIFTALFAEHFLDSVFKGSNMQTAKWISWGSISMVLYVFAFLFISILMRLRKMRHILACGAISLVIHVLITAILLLKSNMNIMALVLGNILFYGVLMVFCFWVLQRTFQYRQEWIHSIAFTIVSAAVAGIIVMLLDKVLAGAFGSLVSMLVCIPIGIVVYMILLVVTRSVTSHEAEEMIGGRIFQALAGLLHFL